jgi:hypothetical protein
MMLRLSVVAVFSTASALAAFAQDGSWGDGHAAIYNSPMGYASQAEFNQQPDRRRPRDKFKPKTPHIGFTSACVNGIAAGLQRPSEEETHGFLWYPCPDVSAKPKMGAALSDKPLTVVTAGASSGAILDEKHPNSSNPPAALNGGLSLD